MSSSKGKSRAKTAGILGRSSTKTPAGKQRAKTAGSKRTPSSDKEGQKSVLYDSEKPPLSVDVKSRTTTTTSSGGNGKEKSNKKKKKKKKKHKKGEADEKKAEDSSKPNGQGPGHSQQQLATPRYEGPRSFYTDDKGGIHRVCQKFKAAPEKRPTTVCVQAPRGTLDHLAVLNMARLKLCPISPKDHPGRILVQFVERNVIKNSSGMPDYWFVTLDTTYEAKEMLQGLRWQGAIYSVRAYDDFMTDEYDKYLKVQNMCSFVDKISVLGILHQKKQVPSEHRITLPTLWQKRLGSDPAQLAQQLREAEVS